MRVAGNSIGTVICDAKYYPEYHAWVSLSIAANCLPKTLDVFLTISVVGKLDKDQDFLDAAER